MGTVEMIEHFRDLVCKLEAENFPDKAELQKELEDATDNWNDVTAALREVYLRLPLFSAAIKNDDLFQYLNSGVVVLEADQRYGTALHRDLPQMTRDKMQVYEWQKEPRCLVVLSRYRQRWILHSAWQGMKGEEVDRSNPFLSEIIERLRTHGVEGPPELVDRLELFLGKHDFNQSMMMIQLA
jgi:hypothetical protein